jgi:hypothetical protein
VKWVNLPEHTARGQLFGRQLWSRAVSAQGGLWKRQAALPEKQDAAPPGAAPGFHCEGIPMSGFELSTPTGFTATGTTTCSTGSRAALALPRGIQLGTAFAGTVPSLRASLSAIVFAFARPHGAPLVFVERAVAILVELRKPSIGLAFGFDIFCGAVQPFLFADHAVTVGVQLGKQLSVAALAFSFFRMQGPCEAQHCNDSDCDCFHGFWFFMVIGSA